MGARRLKGISRSTTLSFFRFVLVGSIDPALLEALTSTLNPQNGLGLHAHQCTFRDAPGGTRALFPIRFACCRGCTGLASLERQLYAQGLGFRFQGLGLFPASFYCTLNPQNLQTLKPSPPLPPQTLKPSNPQSLNPSNPKPSLSKWRRLGALTPFYRVLIREGKGFMKVLRGP